MDRIIDGMLATSLQSGGKGTAEPAADSACSALVSAACAASFADLSCLDAFSIKS
jgi:hypothetical protein